MVAPTRIPVGVEPELNQRLILLLLMGLLVIFVSGIAYFRVNRPVTFEEIMGQWISSNSAADQEASSISFNSDGHFKATKIPIYFIEADQQAGGTVSGRGQWEIDRKGRKVSLLFQSADPNLTTPEKPLHIEMRVRKSQLYLSQISHSSNHLIFIKVGENGTPDHRYK